MDTTDRHNYKESPEGREAARLYGDIIHLSRPASSHPRMDSVQRAKIFAPYDALRGFDEAIDEVNERAAEVLREELSEEEKAALSEKLQTLQKGMRVRITYFVPDETVVNTSMSTGENTADISADYDDTSGAVQNDNGSIRGPRTEIPGNYITVDGAVRQIDPVSRTLSVQTQTGNEKKLEKILPARIRFDDLSEIAILPGEPASGID